MTSIKFESAMVIAHNNKDYLMLEIHSDYEEPVKARKFVSEMRQKTHVAELKIHRKKRSLTANAYAWVLIGKLAAVLNITKTEVYWQYIREVGDNFEIYSVRNEAVEKTIAAWQSIGLGWLCDDLGNDIEPGKQTIIFYFGSSSYDSKQMANLIELIVADCKEQGIETLPPEELERMKTEWEMRERGSLNDSC
ncbi:MAG: hypothetical protein FWC20_01815 [Oscillospiraceae bacterium]|nr:hypothetical protein [Oscillospiraceae bacterium]MCL2278129.1 hypothetical protein [Oscillospiraceae bacterium]